MQRSIAAVSIVGLAIALLAMPARAQTTVQGAVVVQSGPVADAARPRRVIVPEREIIVVQRIHARHGWWKARKYRVVTVYYDGDRYYRRWVHRPGVRKVVVYEWGGRYYLDDDHWKRYGNPHHDDDGDKHDHDDD
jgi:hypothetical protein